MYIIVCDYYDSDSLYYDLLWFLFQKLRGNLNDTKRQLQEEILRRTEADSEYENQIAVLESEKKRLTEVCSVHMEPQAESSVLHDVS